MTEILRILLVEDLPEDADLAEIELRKEGVDFTSEWVHTKEALLNLLPVFKPDLALCDYLLPGFDGLEALSIIKAYDTIIPVIMFTGSQNEVVAVECMKAGASDYILKENITRLPFAVQEALQKRYLWEAQKKAEEKLKLYTLNLEVLNTELVEARHATLNIMEDLNTEIGENERVRYALAENERKYRQLFESMAQGVFYQDASGKLTDVNTSALRMLGLTRDEFLGKTSLSSDWKLVDEDGTVIPGEEHPSMIALRTGQPVADMIVGVLIPKLDTYNWMSVNAIPEFLPGEEHPFRVAVTLHDVTQLRQTEQMLLESTERFMQVAESAGEWIWEVNADGLYTYSNSVVQDILGYSPEEVVGHLHFFDLFLPEEKETIKHAVMETFNAKEPLRNFENRNLHHDGHTVILEKTGFPVVNTKGELLGYRGSDKDFTERKRAEKALQDSEQKYRLLFTQMSEGFALHEIICNDNGTPVDYRFLEINDAFRALTGMIDVDLIGKSVLEVMPATEHRWIATYGKVALTGKPVDFIQYSIDSDKTFEVHAFSPQKNRFATIFSDVSDQVRTEQSLRESENKFRGITEQVADLIFMTNRNGLLVYVSPASKTLFGYVPEEMVPEKFVRFIGEKDVHPILKAFRHAIRTGETAELSLQMIRKDGTTFDGELRARIFKENNRIQGVFGLIRDITDRKKLMEEIRSSREQLQEIHKHVIEAREQERMIISREIHDELGQSLSALKMDLGWIVKNVSDKDRVVTRTKKMITLVSSTIRDVQRISSSLRPGILDDLGLSAACEWYCEEFEKRSGMYIETKIEEAETTSSNANTAIFRILQEGLTNVMRHSQARQVTVEMKQTKKMITLTITDDGVGIPKEKLDARESLGMMGMKERVRQFGGVFDIRSVQGEFTTLQIEIPVNIPDIK